MVAAQARSRAIEIDGQRGEADLARQLARLPVQWNQTLGRAPTAIEPATVLVPAGVP